MPITFDKSTGRFRDANGRFVAASRVHHEINKTVNKLENDLRLISSNLNQGKINLPEWQIQTANKLKIAHLSAAAIGKGGRKQMKVADWGKAGAAIREQYKFLNNFAREIERGKLSPNQISFRSASYAKAVRETFYKQEIELKKEAGFLYCRRILHAAESCVECFAWAAKGWVPIDEQPPIGGLLCRNFCRCELEYSEKAGAFGNWKKLNEKFDETIIKQTSEKGVSCVSAVGEMLMRSRNLSVTQEQILGIIGEPAGINALANCLNKFDPKKGWQAGFESSFDLEFLVDKKDFGVFLKEFGGETHAVFVKEFNERFLIFDPFDQTRYEMTKKDFDAVWTGLYIYRQDD